MPATTISDDAKASSADADPRARRQHAGDAVLERERCVGRVRVGAGGAVTGVVTG